MQLKPNVLALRNLAVSAANDAEALAYYWQAWNVWSGFVIGQDSGAYGMGKDYVR